MSSELKYPLYDVVQKMSAAMRDTSAQYIKGGGAEDQGTLYLVGYLLSQSLMNIAAQLAIANDLRERERASAPRHRADDEAQEEGE